MSELPHQTLHISHGANPDDWFVVKPLTGETATSIAGTPITHDMAVRSLLNAGRTVYELEATAKQGRFGAVLVLDVKDIKGGP